MEVFSWIADNIFGTPVIMLGAIVLVGLVLQKKDFSHVMMGTCKAIIGFLIINSGSNIITGALNIFSPVWQEVFGLQSTALANYLGQDAFTAQFGSAVTLAMTLGFLINVVLARFTPFKYIYLTGHMMFWTTTIFAGIAVQAAGGSVEFWPLTIFLSIIMGLYWTLQPAITQPIVRKITGNDNVALGHTSASAGLLGALAGKFLGNKDSDAEHMNLPKKLEFLRDSNVITALTMAVLFVVGGVIVLTKDTETAQTLVASAGAQNFIVYVIVQSFTFAAGIAVVLTGVRMFIGEIVPAFNGIATKVVPGAKPALDFPDPVPLCSELGRSGIRRCIRWCNPVDGRAGQHGGIRVRSTDDRLVLPWRSRWRVRQQDGRHPRRAHRRLPLRDTSRMGSVRHGHVLYRNNDSRYGALGCRLRHVHFGTDCRVPCVPVVLVS